jgi:hypothetical protein
VGWVGEGRKEGAQKDRQSSSSSEKSVGTDVDRRKRRHEIEVLGENRQKYIHSVSH